LLYFFFKCKWNCPGNTLIITFQVPPIHFCRMEWACGIARARERTKRAYGAWAKEWRDINLSCGEGALIACEKKWFICALGCVLRDVLCEPKIFLNCKSVWLINSYRWNQKQSEKLIAIRAKALKNCFNFKTHQHLAESMR
jgi:hypothetical protein